jgi:hypothetical protein
LQVKAGDMIAITSLLVVFDYVVILGQGIGSTRSQADALYADVFTFIKWRRQAWNSR